MTKTEHPYAQVLRWIADGEDVEVKLGVGWCYEEPGCVLNDINNEHPPEYFRLKPRTININGHEVPEPMRVAPADNSVYFVVAPACPGNLRSIEHRWDRDGEDLDWLARGLCHATREAAETHAKALLSFTTTEAK